MGLFERYLSLWVALCIASGVVLGVAVPEAFQAIASIEYASVNLVVAVFIWVMIYPMMVNVDFASLKDVGKKPKGLCITLVVNWLIKPFSMAALGVLFFEFVFAGIVYLLVAFVGIRLVNALVDGPDAWNAAMESLKNPLYIAFHVLCLVSVIFVSVRFFRLFPKAQPPTIGPLEPPPAPVIQGMLYVVWLGITALMTAILAGVLF